VAATNNFVLRDNADSTTNMICLSCLRTVATVKWETDVAAIEINHSCIPLELEHARYIDSQRGTF
jgi:hypothetical protein